MCTGDERITWGEEDRFNSTVIFIQTSIEQEALIAQRPPQGAHAAKRARARRAANSVVGGSAGLRVVAVALNSLRATGLRILVEQRRSRPCTLKDEHRAVIRCPSVRQRAAQR